MDAITVEGRIISKDLKEIVYEDTTIKCKGLDEKNNMVYTYALPKHIYDNLVDTSDEHQSYQKYMEKKKKQGINFAYSEKYLKKNIEAVLISNILDTIDSYSSDIINLLHRDKLKKTKKIFVKFQSSAIHDRCDWAGGYKGVRVSSMFQFFVGYEVEEPQKMSISSWMDSKERPTVKNYYTLIKHSTGSLAKWSTNFQEGNNLEPFYHTGKRDEFLRTYNIMDWTQEREDYLRELENKFITLNENLDTYLNNLDGEKVDLLATKANELKLLN